MTGDPAPRRKDTRANVRPGRRAARDDPCVVQIVVLSAHLDDAVFSLGAAIAATSRAGVDVVILTVLAGDPSSRVTAGAWDAEAGFATAGEAARARGLEDERACAEVAARPVWLPYSDVQYPRGGSD